jgi:hypothetical protein
MADIFKHAYSLVNPEQKKKDWYEEMEEQVCSYFPSMTFTQRIIGALTCMSIGFLISMGSTLRLIDLLKGNPDPFAITYTVGNLIGICSTCFIYGPWTQAKKMFAPTRYRCRLYYCYSLCLDSLNQNNLHRLSVSPSLFPSPPSG